MYINFVDFSSAYCGTNQIAMAIEREIEDARSIQDAGTSGKRKESHSSSSLVKMSKASSS